ncbi:MAG: molybdenum cofactor guanylyltransferase [Deltaproteobacteria bacterium]|nr:molybdenum cofactor guanylyltransferase [Deltaproteobacteria bacterium]
MFDNVTGIVLAGGESRRMGQPKAAIDVEGTPLLKKSVQLFKELFPRVIAISKKTGSFGNVGCEESGDLFPGMGPMVGILTAFKITASDYLFVAACDMPFLNRKVIELIVEEGQGYDVALPKIGGKGDPLHALYSKNCYHKMLSFMEKGGRSLNRFINALHRESVRYIGEEEIKKVDPHALSLFNMNTPEELEKAKQLIKGGK